MKRCEYCAKEIGYNDMYCCSECETITNKHYTIRGRYQKLISAANIVGTCSIAIGIFIYALVNSVGMGLIAIGGLVTGLITLLLPTPPETFVKKYKLRKAVKLTRVFSIVLLLFAAAAFVFLII